MDRFLEKPVMMRLAAKESRKRNFFVEVLIFLLLLIISSFIQGVITTIPTMIAIFSDAGLWAVIQAGDVAGVVEYLENFTMPDYVLVFTLFATVATIATVLVYVRFIEKRSLRTMGLTKKAVFSEYGIGLLVGLTMFGSVIVLGVLFGGFSYVGVTLAGAVPMFLLLFVMYMIQGASEEFLCRGYFCVSLSKRYSVVVAILANAVIFALLHLANNGISLLALLNLALFGIFASVYMIRRGNLWGVCAIHSVWNFAQGNIFGLLVSGTNSGPSLFTFAQNDGKSLITGGAFGPEGGICVTIVLLVATGIMLAMKNKDKGFSEEEKTDAAANIGAIESDMP